MSDTVRTHWDFGVNGKHVHSVTILGRPVHQLVNANI